MTQHAQHKTREITFTSVYPLAMCISRLRDLHDHESPRIHGISTSVILRQMNPSHMTFTLYRTYRGYHETGLHVALTELPVRVTLRVEGELTSDEHYGPTIVHATIITERESAIANARILLAIVALACVVALLFHFIVEVVAFAALTIIAAILVFGWLPGHLAHDYRRAVAADLEHMLTT